MHRSFNHLHHPTTIEHLAAYVREKWGQSFLIHPFSNIPYVVEYKWDDMGEEYAFLKHEIHDEDITIETDQLLHGNIVGFRIYK